MINFHVVPNEIGVAISPAGNPLVTGFDKQAGIMVSIEIDSQYWRQFLKKAGELNAVGIAPATIEDIAALQGRNGG